MHKRVTIGNNGWMRKDTIPWTWAVSLSLGRFPESEPISWAWADSLGLGRFPGPLIRVMVLLMRTRPGSYLLRPQMKNQSECTSRVIGIS